MIEPPVCDASAPRHIPDATAAAEPLELPPGVRSRFHGLLVQPKIDALIRALHTLPPRMRAVIVLRFYDELSEAETAQALGISVGSVKSQTSRGLNRMREGITEDSKPGHLTPTPQSNGA